MGFSSATVVGLVAVGALVGYQYWNGNSSGANSAPWNRVHARIVDVMDSPRPEHPDNVKMGSYGPIFVRLAWHSAGTYSKADGTGGTTGATMRFQPESGHGANAGLGIARDVLEPIYEEFKDEGVSRADLWAYAGGVAIEQMGGPNITFRPGRKDAKTPTEIAPTPSDRLPDAAQGAKHVREVFYRMGFNDREIVALVGAHCLGKTHIGRSGFEGPWTLSPTTFSNAFFVDLLNKKWSKGTIGKSNQQYINTQYGQTTMMLPADMAFKWDKQFHSISEEYAKDQDSFFNDFAPAWTKLMELGCDNLGEPVPHYD